MASKKSSDKKNPVPDNLPPNIPVGIPVVILRPHLWGGCHGRVVKHVDGVKHLIAIEGKDGAVFHTECYSTNLVQENQLWPDMEIIL